MADYSICGIDCEKCEVGHSNGCSGCKENKGKVFWGECDLYKCNSEKIKSIAENVLNFLVIH